MLSPALVLVFLCASLTVVFANTTRVNIVHVTDVHGWVNAHPHEPELDADFGDFTSFIEHMQQLSRDAGEEFFLFDTGDLLEGTGYSDASPIKGQYILPIVQSVKAYSGLTMGNHDMEYDEVVDLFRETFIPYWNDDPNMPKRYITENQYYKSSDSPLGATYSSFKTELGLNVLVLGWLYNFTSNSDNTYVIPPPESLEESYIQEALSIPDTQLLVAVCHIDTSDEDMESIYQYLRKYMPDLTLVLLAGHRHITSFKQFDDNAFTIESGRYFEKLGLIRLDLDTVTTSMSWMQYEWIDTTMVNFYNLTGKDETNFLTPAGEYTKQLIADTVEALGLDIIYGCSPITYQQYASLSDDDSLYSLYIDDIVPAVVFNYSLPNTQFFFTNPYTLRYNLYQGVVTRNDIYTISPFNDTYYYYPNMDGETVLNLVYDLGFYHTYIYVDTSAYYDVVVAEYDTTAVTETLTELGESYPFYVYPTKVNSTGALQIYIEDYFLCSDSCPCS